MINGNLSGVKKATVERLEALWELSVERDCFASAELLEEMAYITADTGREVSVYLSRAGDIEYVAIGEADRVNLDGLTLRRSEERLSSLRCIHTHPNGDARLSIVDLQSLKKLRLDAMAAVGVKNGAPFGMAMAVLCCDDEGRLDTRQFFCADVQELPHAQWLEAIAEADRAILKTTLFEVEPNRQERVALLGHDEASLEELAGLTDTAGGRVVLKIVQKRSGAAERFGKGKLEEAALQLQAVEAELAIYDDELTAVEQKNMEEKLGVRVLDRTALILDIFAMRARSREGQLQVELAQSRYALTRLIGEGTVLSRQGGGIGTKGPGEKKLETDRRHIRSRIYELERQLKGLTVQRELQRKKRVKNGVPQIALVGYTNAGKSTLLNRLTGADAYVQDKLFATLDPLVRGCALEKGTEVCLIDTVGFIRKLPHHLVEAFRSTLEEAAYADMLLHVCDASNPELAEQMRAVEEVLEKIGAAALPRITVLNKMDKAEPSQLLPVKEAVLVSAATGEGTEELKQAILQKLSEGQRTEERLIPYTRGDALAFIHSSATVLSEEYLPEGTKVVFRMQAQDLMRLNQLVKPQETEGDL